MLTTAAFTIVLIICSVSDVRSREIGIEMPIILAAIALVHSALNGTVQQSLIVSTGTFVVLMILSLLSKQAIGLGDVAVLSACAVFTTVYSIVLVFSLAILFATIVTIMKMLTREAKQKKISIVSIPFIPYITAGFVLMLVKGGAVC